MKSTQEERIWMYFNAIRGMMAPDGMLEGLILAAETKAENAGKDLPKNDAYNAMLKIADNLQTHNPFKDEDQFYQAYQQIEGELDWESLLYKTLQFDRIGSILVPKVLLSEMISKIKSEAKTILVAEAEKFVPNLKALVDAHPGCEFTLTSMNELYARVLERIFADYKNVTVLCTSIYKYNFIEQHFDFILSVPTFGGRDLAEDVENFMCREMDMVALENLLLHLSGTGKLSIVMPARVTFAGGRVGELRRFVTQMYNLVMVAELPDGIFQNTGIKTYLLSIASGRTEDVIIRRYSAVDRKSKRGPVEKLEITDDTFSFIEELEETGDWSVDRLLAQQDEEYMKYQASDIRKIALGEVAEIFRGKSVTKKDANGDIGVVNISNIGQYEIDYDTLDKLDESERKVQNYILQEGDIVLPARGTAIRTAVFKKQKYPCIASSNVIIIRPDQKKMNGTYLKIFIDSPIGNNMISSLQQGMAVMNISYKDLKVLEVPFPSLEVQEKVAKEYTESYEKYVKSISEAEQNWQDTLNKLQKF